MSDKIELLPCPFCGGKAHWPEPEVNIHYVGCMSCAACATGVEDWNRRAALAQQPAPVAQDPAAWQDPENLDRICSARSMLEAKRTGGATLSALKPLTRPLYAAPAAPVAQEQVECRHKACESLGRPHPFCRFVRQQEAAQPAAEQPTGTTSDQYRAELYDEVWGKARSMGYGNVTDALAELERLKAAEQPDTVAVPRAQLEQLLDRVAHREDTDKIANELCSILLGKEGEA